MSEEKYSQLFHSTRDAILIRSLNGNTLDANQSAVDLFGYTRDELLSIKLTKIADKETIQQIVEAINVQGWTRIEATLRRKNGETFIADVSSNFVDIGKEKVIQTVISDITERKQAENNLKRSEENYKALAESSVHGIAILQDDRIVYSNQAYADMMGCTIDEILNLEVKHMSNFIHTEDVVILREAYSRFLEGSETSTHQQFRIIRRDGTCRWINSHFAVIQYDGEDAIQIVQVDNTDRIESEKKIEESRNRAEFFLDLMSHDLSNINQAVYGIFDILLLDTGLTNRTKELIQEGLYQMIRSNRLIKNVQKFKKIEDSPPELTPTNPLAALTKATDRVQKDLPYKELNLKTKIEPELLEVMADEYLTDAFYAVLHNAMRFDPEPSVDVDISMVMSEDKSRIRIDIADHGTGIPDQTKGLLFGRVSLLSSGHLGTGVGLTLLNRIISHYGGKIVVENRVPGDYSQGARFIIEIPAVPIDSARYG